jgi:hypothetical protein
MKDIIRAKAQELSDAKHDIDRAIYALAIIQENNKKFDEVCNFLSSAIMKIYEAIDIIQKEEK